MSHFFFHTAQIPTTTTSAAKTLPLKPSLPPIPQLCPRQQLPVVQPVTCKLRRNLVIKCSSPSIIDGGESVAALERCFLAPDAAPVDLGSASSSRGEFGPVMKGKYGAFGAVTLEKGKLDLSQKESKISPEVALGGGGGDIGKKINHGGGDGGDDDGDDDDYFDDFDDDDEGDDGGLFRRRKFLEELFDRKFVDAVLNEWQKTMMDLPAGFRQAYEMGLVSSAQMVKFLAINARPTTTRMISRALPQAISRAFIGRMLADPAFLYRLLLEQAVTIGCSVWWEVKNRKDRIKQEWDLALVNILTATACNAIVVWTLAPCRSYGNTFRLSVTVPPVSNYARGYGAFLGLYANLRYQLLCGFDRAVVNYFDVIGVALFFSTALRILNVQVGETSRLAWMGAEADPLVQSDNLLKAYNRPSEDVATLSSSNWFISKKTLVSGLGLLGIKQGNADSVDGEPSSAPKARRKRVIRKKVSAS
ncbi:hypothetical protein GH714_018562 [Hevea brasiliensis]|uniref:Uncharacterized protein n=1 Tax=Hevea brasiliensis TaxID=3981 RepID=A0A6A6N5C1_HEVBR|nr:hypothetical protein GH714_018562 [Hevea brasiliensis]